MTLRRVVVALAIVLCAATHASRARAATLAGTVITNSATLALTDGNGVVTTIASNTVRATVAAVSGVVVGIKEKACNPATDAFATGAQITRTFSIANSSNIPEAYTIAATASAGTVVGITVGSASPVAFSNGATTATLEPGAALVVTVTVATTNVAIGTNVIVSLAATSTATGAANGRASDVATQCAIAAGSAKLVGPGGPSAPISKLVDDAPFESTDAGTNVTYRVTFVNSGGVPALDVVVTDDVPSGISPKLGSVTIDGVTTTNATLVGPRLVVHVGTLAPLAATVVAFTATVDVGQPIGKTFVNVATVASSNAPSSQTTSASVLVGVANVVYDGYIGANAPVGGATVVLIDPATGKPIALPTTGGIAPNSSNTDPFVTGPNGKYSFVFTAPQLGFAPGAAPVAKTFVMTIAGPGYLNRRIQLVITPDASGTLYDATITSLDGQPLARAGGFSLQTEPVTLAHLFGLFGNLPLFRAQSVQITKSVDRTFAASGDRLFYTLNFSNIGTPLGATTLVDTLPAGVAFAPGSAELDGVKVVPVGSGRTLTFALPALTSARKITYAAVILPGVPENSVLRNTVTIASSPANAPTVSLTASSSVDTRVIAGVFTDRSIVTGRVFLDTARSGYFERGDVGLASVRIYLEDGESIASDRDGRFSFPGVRPGMHVLRVDSSTLPANARPYADRNFESQKSIRRLVHGVFDGGVIEDIDFAIEARS